MSFRFVFSAAALLALAGCAVPVGQIRNGRFVSEEHGSLRIRNQTIAFDLQDLPPGARVKKRVPYRLRPDREIELSLRLGEDYRSGVGAYLWRLEDGAITATARREATPTAVFTRPGERAARPARRAIEPPLAEEPAPPASSPGVETVPILLE